MIYKRISHMIPKNPTYAVMLVVIAAGIASCSGETTTRADKQSGADTASAKHANGSAGGMAAMPGMKAGTGADSNGSDAAIPAEIRFTAAQVQHGGVKWSSAAIASVSASAVVPGQIEANEDRTARLEAPARGRVVSVSVSPGDRVTNGEALVRLESADAGMAQSDVAKAEADLSARKAQAIYARTARQRAERLLALKAIPQQDYERAVADDELATSTLEVAQAELRRARGTAHQIGASASVSGEITIRSPLAGVVLARSAVPGTVVDAGAPLIVVTDPSSLWLVVNAPEKMSALFHVGQPLRFTVPAFAADTFVARTQAVGAGLDAETRTLHVRGVVASAGRLKAEMLASVTVVGGSAVRAVVLPDDAVQIVGGTPTVFTAAPDSKGGVLLTRHVVEVGPHEDGRVAITRGLAPGDVVVIAGGFGIKAEFEKANMPKMEM